MKYCSFNSLQNKSGLVKGEILIRYYSIANALGGNTLHVVLGSHSANLWFDDESDINSGGRFEDHHFSLKTKIKLCVINLLWRILIFYMLKDEGYGLLKLHFTNYLDIRNVKKWTWRQGKKWNEDHLCGNEHQFDISHIIWYMYYRVQHWQPIFYSPRNLDMTISRRLHVLTNHIIPEQQLNLSVVSSVPAVESSALCD